MTIDKIKVQPTPPKSNCLMWAQPNGDLKINVNGKWIPVGGNSNSDAVFQISYDYSQLETPGINVSKISGDYDKIVNKLSNGEYVNINVYESENERQSNFSVRSIYIEEPLEDYQQIVIDCGTPLKLRWKSNGAILKLINKD